MAQALWFILLMFSKGFPTTDDDNSKISLDDIESSQHVTGVEDFMSYKACYTH